MVGDITKDNRSPLLPDRQDQKDFFVCDIFDAAPKGDMASMAHPIFSLSTKPDHHLRRYEDESGKNYVEIRPSSDGLATIHDRDILIYCISQVIAALNEGREVQRVVRLKAYDLLKATNRVTDGRGYKALRASLIRLQGTQIETNISTGGTEQLDIFSIIDRARIIRETRDGRMQEIEVELSDWVFNAIRAHEVLTLHRNYFRLRKPLERRLYELARKHCGRQKQWKIGLSALQRKCGSISTMREFRRLIGAIIEQDKAHHHMPDYAICMEGDMVLFENRGTMDCLAGDVLDDQIKLGSEAHEKARAVAPGWDVHYLEQTWRSWMADGGLDAPRDPEKAFIGFCSKWFEKRGRPS
ncbi:replication initiator protein A [Roseovarius sp. D0-M9]|uniref:replication initiator protein A n=1 Tax=Roseovarius sp. D0-M9 TaxID=3127117 RepID=UPI00300FCD14